jgi:Protein-arginine deiminase (PAD)/Protein-arginine deiminase (PAD) middle domain
VSAAADRLLARTDIAKAKAAAAACVLPCQPAPPVQALDVRVRDAFKKSAPVPNADVAIMPARGGAVIETKQTDSSGDVIFRLPVGDYLVTARKDWHGPDPASQDKVNVPAFGFPVVNLVLEEILYHLHNDADRDGSVDANRSGLDKWEWGKGKKGAIVYANNDDDGGRSNPDNTDAVVNTGNDPDDIAPFEIRRVGPNDPPASWEGVLEVAAGAEQFIRIFDSRSAGANELIGPATGAKFKLPDLKFSKREFGIEAVQYADSSWDGEALLTFTLNGNGPTKAESAKFHVAPWMMPNHLDAATEVYVVDAGAANSRYRSDLKTMVTAAGCTLNESATPGDIWMQDCMEIGFSNLPSAGMHTVMRNPRNRPLKVFAKTLLKADFGYHEKGTLSDITFDSTGNLECTPPVKNFPWGRIYFGPGRPLEEMDDDTKTFLKQQIVQKPIEIDTNFLAVGHVDEIITFVKASGGKGFRLLLASPKRAYTILTTNKAAHGSEKMMIGRSFPAAGSAEVTIKDFLDVGVLGQSAASIKTFNDSAQTSIDGVRGTFKAELGLSESDIIDVPGLFIPNRNAPTLADALTAGMVNMLVINGHCIVPKPFGPVVGGKDLFEEDLKSSLSSLPLTVSFLDDWKEYHVKLGEVHCSSNTLRTPTLAKWWEFKP